jgi:hypothetical protein
MFIALLMLCMLHDIADVVLQEIPDVVFVA